MKPPQVGLRLDDIPDINIDASSLEHLQEGSSMNLKINDIRKETEGDMDVNSINGIDNEVDAANKNYQD